MSILKSIEAKMDIIFGSEEGVQRMQDFFARLQDRENIKQSQLERFHQKYGDPQQFETIVERICNKYESPKYHEFWLNKGFEPPETLYYFLYDYAAKYGRELTPEELKKYCNMFTAGIFYVNGYYFNLMHGQGSVVMINKAINI